MAQTKLSKPQSSSDKKLHIAVIVCIVLVIASFVANILLIIDYSKLASIYIILWLLYN